MIRIVYTGSHRDTGASDGNEAAATIAYGIAFPKGVPVEVTDATAARKLTGNPYFRIAADAPQPEPLPASGEEPINPLLTDANYTQNTEPGITPPKRSRRK